MMENPPQQTIPKPSSKIGWRWLILLLVIVPPIFTFLYTKLLHCIWYADETSSYSVSYTADNLLGKISPELLFFIVLFGSICSLFIGFRKRYGPKRFAFLFIGLAVIGLLYLLFSNLGAARNKAYRTSTISHVYAMRVQAELYFGSHNSYGIPVAGNCDIGGSIFTAPDGLRDLLAETSRFSSSQVCYSTPDSWSVSVELPRGRPVGLLCPVTSNNFWCADSAGNSFETSRHINGPSCEGLRVFRAGESLQQ